MFLRQHLNEETDLRLQNANRIKGKNSPEANEIRKQLMIRNGIPEEAIYTDKDGILKMKGYSEFDGETIIEGDEKGKGLFGGLFGGLSGGDKKNKNVRNNDKEMTEGFSTYGDFDDFDDGVGFDELIDDDSTIKSGDRRGLLGAIGGTIECYCNLTDFDRRGGKPSGLMRGLTGTIEAALVDWWPRS